MRVRDEISKRDIARGGDNRSAAIGNGAHDLPGVQPPQAKQKGQVPFCDLQVGWRGLELLALQLSGRGILR